MTRYINSPKVSVWKISASIFLLATAGFVAPTLYADEPVPAPAEVKVAALDVTTASPDYAQMSAFMSRASANSWGRPSLAYKKLRKDTPAFFEEYEAYLTGIDVDGLSSDDQLAYWLNLQNFLVVKAVTQDTSKTNLKSLRGTGSKPGKLWTKERVTIGGESYSVADIERKVLTEFDNPNVLYGIYQGVKGGPCLSDIPYQGVNINERLDELAKHYVNSRGIVTPEKGVASVTPVYAWYKADLFEDNEKTLLAHLKTNATTSLRGRLNTVRKIKYTKLNYDTDNLVPKDRTKGQTDVKRKSGGGGGGQPRPPSNGSGGGGGGGSYGS